MQQCFVFAGRNAVDGSKRRIVSKYAACGWAVVQMDLDGGMTPWYGVEGITSISLEVQRTIKRTAIFASCKPCGPSDFLSDNGGKL